MPMKKSTWVMGAACGHLAISAAMVAVMVRAGDNNAPGLWHNWRVAGDHHYCHCLAIALPIPSMTAVSTPERAAGKVTRQMVCQRVAPAPGQRRDTNVALRPGHLRRRDDGRMEIAASSSAPESALNRWQVEEDPQVRARTTMPRKPKTTEGTRPDLDEGLQYFTQPAWGNLGYVDGGPMPIGIASNAAPGLRSACAKKRQQPSIPRWVPSLTDQVGERNLAQSR